MARQPVRTPSRMIEPADLESFLIPSDVQLSPDGQLALFTLSTTNKLNKRCTQLYIAATDNPNSVRSFTAGDNDRHGRWSPDGSRVVFTSQRENKRDNLYQIPTDGGEAVRLTDFPEGSISGFQWSPDGRCLAVAFREVEPDWSQAAQAERKESGASTPARVIDDLYYRLDGDGYFNNQRHKLYIVDVSTGEHRLVFDRDKSGRFEWDWSPDATELIVAANTSQDALLTSWKVDLFRVNAKTGKAKKVTGLPEGTKAAVCWSPDGTKIAYAGRAGREIWGVGNTQLFIHDLTTNRTENLFTDHDYCLMAVTISDAAEAVFNATLMWSSDSQKIITTIGWRGTSHLASIDAANGDVEFHSSGRKVLALTSVNENSDVVGLTVTNQTTLPEVYVGAFENGSTRGKLKLTRLTRFHRQALGRTVLAKPESHWVTSADGHRVQVWVLRPPAQKTDKKYPAVLEIHGGPHCQYGEAYFHEFQVLAAAGYGVVFSNPRGSKGYGEDHCMAIKGRWGQADWQDIQAVTKFMQQQDWIDPTRLGVMGGSYGGYMTNWVISHTHDFAAAITDRCVSNLISMIGSSDLPLVPDEYWPGNGWDETAELWEQSPLKHFRNVKTPTLVIHSEGDLRCNVEQGEQVFAALKLLGVPTRFVRYPFSTSHGLSRMGPADLRIHRLQQILRWWDEHLS